MKNPRCIRYFKNSEMAQMACDLLKSEGFECYVTEDKFLDIALKELGMISRFRLYVEKDDINKIGEILAVKIKGKK